MKTKSLYNVLSIVIAGMLGIFQATAQDWSLTGNSGTTNNTNFIGTTDNVPLTIKVNGVLGGKIDNSVLFYCAFGYEALKSNNNYHNSAFGNHALYSNTNGQYNTAVGRNALEDNTKGNWNVAVGGEALADNTTANYNVAIGMGALQLQSFNNNNVAWESFNVAIGANSLLNNQPTSTSNGIKNTAVGYDAGRINTTGYKNTFIGYSADGGCASCSTLINATAIGYNAKVDANNSMVLGGTGSDAVSVGIGTTTPSTLFDIETSTSGSTGIDINNTASDGDPRIAFQLSGTSAFTMGVDDSDSDKFKIGTTAVETSTRLTIDGSGNVGIGTTAPGALFETSKSQAALTTIRVRNDDLATAGTQVGFEAYSKEMGAGIDRRVFRIWADKVTWTNNWGTGLQANLYMDVQDTRSGSTNYGSIRFRGVDASENIAEWMRIQNGQVGIGMTATQMLSVYNGSTTGHYTTTGWTHSSDSRLKTNIKPLENSLEKIVKLQGVSYNWNKTPSTDSQVGFIAQEVERVFPEVIVKDTNGNYSMAPQNLTAPIIEAIKEQQKMIKDLQAEIVDMKAEMNTCCISNSSSGSNSGTQIPATTIHELELANNAVLFQNSPNPFGEGTTIKYFVPDNSQAQIVFYDEFGNKLKELSLSEKGMGQLNIATMNLAAGVYSYSLLVNGKVVDTKRMMKVH